MSSYNPKVATTPIAYFKNNGNYPGLLWKDTGTKGK